ncbi:MAG: helix-turn-helix transcriptional regulator [Bdellovibrionia bacterium]
MPIPEEKTYRILSAIKQIMKQKKIRYPELAKELGVSVPTVKRCLNGKDLPLQRLLDICSVLELELDDLLAFSNQAAPKSFRFTEAQESFLAKNPSYLAYFYELRRGLAPIEIEKHHGISRKSSNDYLKQLDRMALIRANGVNDVKIRVTGTIFWDDHGPLGMVFSKEMIRGLASRVVSQMGQDSESYLALWGRSLKNEEYDELKRDIQELDEKYRKKSDYNRKVLPKGQLRHLSCAFMSDFWDSEVFGRVTELGDTQKRAHEETIRPAILKTDARAKDIL